MGSNQSSGTVEDGVGRDSREGYYYFGRLVVREGEAVTIYDTNGAQSVVVGPTALRPYFSEVQVMERVTCDEQSYLVIDFLDGRKEHRRGPTYIFRDPTQYSSVTVEKAILLEANQVLVVYTEHEHQVTRRLVRGPEVFIPQANEWLHKFSWHGTVIAGKKKGSITGMPDDKKTAHAVEFTKLRQLPDQMYYTVRDLRTSDDALLTLHIMIFFELVDIERMLDATNDPIADIINAANADVMTFGANRTYEQLLSESSGLSDNANYPLLETRMDNIGYILKKVVYRGYQTSSQLQSMQEQAISARTKLRLEGDTQRHEHQNSRLRLEANEEQAVHKFSIEQKEMEHKNMLMKMKADQLLEETRAKNELELSHLKAKNDERKRYLQHLVEMNVDLTKYLCAEVSSKPTSHLLIENAGDTTSTPNLHIH